MAIILNKQARFITVPYLAPGTNALKNIRLFGYTTELTDEEVEIVVNHPLLKEFFAKGDLRLVNEEAIDSVQLVNNAPVANGSEGTFPISSNKDKKVNDKIYKKLEGMAADGSEVELDKVVPAKKTTTKKTTRKSSTSSDS